MARDVLAMPASMVASESAFSIGGCTLNTFGTSVTPKVLIKPIISLSVL